MNTADMAARASSRPAAAGGGFDTVADIVVAGGGAGGLPAALFARWQGNDVILLEKAPQLGGTANKAAFWYWVPNNRPMREAGIVDEEEAFLRYVARLSRPQSYDPDSPTLGKDRWEFDAYRAFYRTASDAVELLAEKDALVYRPCPEVPDYWSQIPEDEAAKGRVLVPAGARESMSDGGKVAVASLSRAAYRDGVDVRLSHRVQRLIVDGGRVVGVEATTPDGRTVRVGARKAVVFATGGFTHDPQLRYNFLSVPAYGGCGALTNEGDIVRITSRSGVQLRNMNHAWMCPIPLEKALRRDPEMSGMFSVAGDSTIFVNKAGRRTVNEKLPYNELAQHFFRWDPDKAEYPNLVMIQIWDRRSQEHSASDEYGRLIVPEGTPDYHVIKGDTFEELAANIAARLESVRAHTGGLALEPDFVANLRASIKRFNGFAEAGVDEDFHRGGQPIQFVFNGPVKEDPDKPNATMAPISAEGPYYAALVTGGTLDTKGGPRTDVHGRIVDVEEEPIPGLYGVGNCTASASAQAYWAGGATIGPIIAQAYRAANAAHEETAATPETAAAV
ncbi:FAD-dependent oxidoreductase [Arthrobacter sp. GCM10027362]|uniref:FAD-dependent oxidoreductase n=1 Tax=Arthrobacter sp. GCM10027362 TaxID=3273379 RepID=UPI00363470A2